MREKTILIAEKLKDQLKNDPDILLLNKREQIMEESEEVQALSYKKDLATSDYNDILKIYKEDSPEAKKYRHLLYLAKKELEEHPLVREYLYQYSVVRIKLEEVNHLLFDDFSNNLCPSKE